MTKDTIQWLRWRHPRSGKTLTHAMVPDAEGRVDRSVCGQRPPKEAVVVELVAVPGDRCTACDNGMRERGRFVKREHPDPKTSYRPRRSFEKDWESK